MHTSVKPARVLIVDDHPNTAAMLSRVLSNFETPLEILTACSGEEALNMVDDSIVDILITDFMMPGMNGLELIEKFKGGREPAHTILITAYDTPGLALTARRLKVNDYLVKPVQPEKIKEIVSNVLDEIVLTKKKTGNINSLRTAKVLIADDYPDNIKLLASRLRSEGYSCISAEDGEETLQKIRSDKPDIVLLDVNMPVKDGFEVLAELREDPEISHIPVIIITAARIGPQDIREGLTLGADDYITKPFDWRELAARIRTKLRVKQSEDELRRRNQELGVLPEIGHDISRNMEVGNLVESVLKRTFEALEASDSYLLLFQTDEDFFTYNFDGDNFNLNHDFHLDQLTFTNALIAQLSTARQGMIIEDVNREERWITGNKDRVRSAIAVPLLGNHDVIGILILTSDQIAHFNSEQLVIVQAIANQAAIALENAQLLSVERRRVQELVALNQLTRDISLFTSTNDLFEKLPGLIQKDFEFPFVALWLMDDDQLILKKIVGNDDIPAQNILEIVPFRAAKNGQPAQASGSIDSFGLPRNGDKQPCVHSVIAVPIFWQSKVSGVISIHSQKIGTFQDSDRVLLETIAAQVATAYERIFLFESIEQQRNSLSAVLNGAPDAILLFDHHKRLQLVNPAGECLFTDVKLLVGHELPPKKGYDEFIHILSNTTTATETPSEISWPDGRTFSISFTPIEEGGQVAILHDISQFKSLEEIKNEFIATASHDLKNPIFAVLGYSDLLKQAGPLNDMQVDFIKRIRNASLQMQDLVLNLLEIARMEMCPEMKFESIDMNGLIQFVSIDFHTQIQARKHELQVSLTEEPCIVRGDRKRLEQALRNLISNAIKYTPDGGKIIINSSTKDGDAIIEVADNGIGIPADNLPHIFEQFYRVQAPETENIEGNGLGLAIVKTIIERHGGNVYVESKEGEGSCFSIKLQKIKTIRGIEIAHVDM